MSVFGHNMGRDGTTAHMFPGRGKVKGEDALQEQPGLIARCRETRCLGAMELLELSALTGDGDWSCGSS